MQNATVDILSLNSNAHSFCSLTGYRNNYYDNSPFYILWKQQQPRGTHAQWDSSFGITPSVLDRFWDRHASENGGISRLHLLWLLNFLCEGCKSSQNLALRWGTSAKIIAVHIEELIPIIAAKFNEVLLR